MDYKEQGLAIRGARLERRMTQAHLAGLAGVSEKTVRRAECGDRLQADSVRALCAALGLDASELRTEAEMRPDVAAEVSSALVAQAARVRLLLRAFALSAVATGVMVAFRDEPLTWTIGKWVVTTLITAFFVPVLANLVLLAVEAAATFMPGARRYGAPAAAGQAWLKRRQWAMSGTIAAVLMPLVLVGASAALVAFVREPSLLSAAASATMLYFVLMQANMATDAMLDLDDDPAANAPGPLSRGIDRAIAASLRVTAQPLLMRALQSRQARNGNGEA